jgi:putative resolvase
MLCLEISALPKKLPNYSGCHRVHLENGVIEDLSETPRGKRLYDVEQFVKKQLPTDDEKESNVEKQKICYCRVSSIGQKNDLERQITYMQEQYPKHSIVSDIASGINFKRKGLRAILELASQGVLSEVVVAYRDRLCRFAFELIEWLLHSNGVKLVVLNESLDSSGNNELVEDLLAIVNVFNCRNNGKRKYKNPKGKEKQTQEDTKNASEPVSESAIEAES